MKGISNIVSAIIILAVGLSIASIYAEWAPDLAEAIGEGISDQTSDQIKCDNAGIAVKDVEYDKSGQIIEFNLENTGTIRFSKGIHAAAYNSSNQINRTTIEELEVGETHHASITSSKIPDIVVLTTVDCPSITREEEQIDVHR